MQEKIGLPRGGTIENLEWMRITASIGLAQSTGESFDQVFERTEAALNQAKDNVATGATMCISPAAEKIQSNSSTDAKSKPHTAKGTLLPPTPFNASTLSAPFGAMCR